MDELELIPLQVCIQLFGCVVYFYAHIFHFCEVCKLITEVFRSDTLTLAMVMTILNQAKLQCSICCY